MELKAYIAVVYQPACANVILVAENGEKSRLVQKSHAFCEAFAYGYAASEINSGGYFGEIKRFRCSAGDAMELTWLPASLSAVTD
jgi:hypothetical protein